MPAHNEESMQWKHKTSPAPFQSHSLHKQGHGIGDSNVFSVCGIQ